MPTFRHARLSPSPLGCPNDFAIVSLIVKADTAGYHPITIGYRPATAGHHLVITAWQVSCAREIARTGSKERTLTGGVLNRWCPKRTVALGALSKASRIVIALFGLAAC